MNLVLLPETFSQKGQISYTAKVLPYWKILSLKFYGRIIIGRIIVIWKSRKMVLPTTIHKSFAIVLIHGLSGKGKTILDKTIKELRLSIVVNSTISWLMRYTLNWSSLLLSRRVNCFALISLAFQHIAEQAQVCFWDDNRTKQDWRRYWFANGLTEILRYPEM